MVDHTVSYLPLKQELRALLVEADKILKRVSFYQRSGDPLEMFDYLQLKFHDSSTAQAAQAWITAFAQARDELGYGAWRQSEDALRRRGHDPSKMSPDLAVKPVGTSGEPDNVLEVHYDSFVPKEYRLFLEDVIKTHLHFFPMAPSLVSSLKQFLETYASLEIIKLLPFSFDSQTNAYSDENIALLHKVLLALTRQIISIVLPHRPVHITIDGDTNIMTICVDGSPKRLSPTQTRGAVALALLPYDHWFPVVDFYRLVYPNLNEIDPRNFGAALDIFKKEHQPFGWDVDDVLRRVKGVVIESLVDEVVLRTYLTKKKKA